MDIFGFQFDPATAFNLLIGIVAGAIITFIITRMYYIKQIKASERQIKQLKEEFNKLKKELEEQKKEIVEEIKRNAVETAKKINTQIYLNGVPETLSRERAGYYIKGLEKMREYSWEEAIKSFQIALVGNPPDNEKMVLDFLIGLCYHKQDKLDQALGNYKESLETAKKIKDKKGISVNLGNIGLIYKTRGDLDKALEYHKEALKIDKEIGNKEGEAQDLGNIGVIYQTRGDLDKALEYHKEALKITREIGNKEDEARS
ncbi:MAG: tetratricopeptide repeat protein, partial [candidate division WOR-3 bacterium]